MLEMISKAHHDPRKFFFKEHCGNLIEWVLDFQILWKLNSYKSGEFTILLLFKLIDNKNSINYLFIL